MSLRSPLFGSQQQQPDPNFQDTPTQSWYPPSVVGSSSRPSTPGSSSASPHQRASDHPQHSSRGQPSPAEAAGIIARLKDKSIEDLQRLLKDKEAYNAFFNSLDQVKTQNNVRDELKKETLELAKENLEKEQLILELRNQYTKEKATSTTPPVDSVPGCDMDKREKIRQKNEKKHQRQKERRAQELHERCKGYLMSRKLDVLAQKLVAMGFSSDQATMALIQNEGCVEESVTWLCNFDGSEEAKHQLAADQQSAANLKIDIADELAKIVSLEAKYKCTKQEVERSVVSCEGDLEKVEEVLMAHKQESTSVPSKPEGSGDSSGLANKQQVVLAQNPARPQASGFSSVGGQQMRREEKDLNYKLVVNGSGPKEPAIKGFLPSAAQSKPELAHQQFVPPEKRRFNANSVPSVSYVASSPLPVAVPQLKSDMRHAVGGNEMRNAMSSGNLRESVTLMQRPQSSSTKQSLPSTSHSKFALEPSSRDWYSTFNGTSSVDMMLNGGLGHGLRNMSLDTINSIRPFGHANHQQSFVSNPIELAASGWGGTWGSGDTSSRAVVSSFGAFRGWSSSESSSTLSHADWRTNGLAPCDYTSVDWSVGKSLLNQAGKSEQLSDTWSTMFMGGRSARAPGNLGGAGGLHDHNHPMDPAPTPRSYD